MMKCLFNVYWTRIKRIFLVIPILFFFWLYFERVQIHLIKCLNHRFVFVVLHLQTHVYMSCDVCFRFFFLVRQNLSFHWQLLMQRIDNRVNKQKKKQKIIIDTHTQFHWLLSNEFHRIFPSVRAIFVSFQQNANIYYPLNTQN